MPRLQGKINKLYDNRKDRNGNKAKYPSYKLFISGDQVLIYTDKEISVKEGDTVALTYDVSKNNNWYVIKNPDGEFSINKIELDDDLPQSEKEWLAAPPEEPTDFSPVSYEKEMVSDKKGMTIFVQGMIQADIRAGNIKLNEVTESTLAHVIDLYKKLTK
jgi:hypothetical protein